MLENIRLIQMIIRFDEYYPDLVCEFYANMMIKIIDETSK